MNKTLFLFIFTFILLSSVVSFAVTVKDVEEHLMCQCEDRCGKMLKNCTCKFSDEMRSTIASKLKDGLTKDEILAFYIGQYGEKVLSAPTKKGFNLVAWITPFIVILLGAIVIRMVIAEWVKKKKDSAKETTQQIQISKNNSNTKYINQLKKDLNEFDS